MEKLYKIIAVSNFDLETVSDILIADNVDKEYGEKLVSFINNMYEHATYFYKLVEQDYKLYTARYSIKQ